MDTKYFENITELKEYVTKNDISNIVVNFGNLTYDDIINNINIFKKIQGLNCSRTQITEIPKELVNLRILDCSRTLIQKIPKEFVNLHFLDCSYTNIIEISKEFVNLNILKCSHTNIIKIPKEFVNLTSLDCSYTNIIEIPKEFVNILEIICMDSKITEIPFTLELLENIVSKITLEEHKENVNRYKNEIKDIIKTGNVLNDDVSNLLCSYI